MSKTYFVSYNKNDVAWAEWIAWVVEDVGNKVIIQAWDFVPGNSWTQEMHNATKNSDSTICVLTEDFLNSDFTAAEWQVAFADDPLGEKRKIIPIKVKECKPDGLLKARVYADIVGKDKNTAKEIVKTALLYGRRKPVSEPSFPSDHGKEPNFPKEMIRYAIVLDGEFEESEKRGVETLLQHLGKKLKDPSISIIEITRGSIVVHVESAYETFRKLQQEFFEADELELNNEKIIGIWQLEQHAVKPVDQRLEFYRSSLISFFMSKAVGEEAAEDLAQDVLVNIVSDQNKYKYLSSPALTINLARVAFSRFAQEMDDDATARSGYVNPSGEVDWDEVYRASVSVLNNLSSEDHFILEQYWDSKFAEGKFDHVIDQEEAERIDAAVEQDIYTNFISDS
ncbi:toll/interleukin-1 receptor domain-containing protein [Pseudomonas sp. B21-053]|uniref:toll/interleukin-1 receptor domain-containing protein n=1 Tax=Pseudomonas sp. B21-053 TaxID=2895493 RepID=UPI00222E5FF1|nr:toll/interleukin-1 receptor domain-containing protein [Pseudomonas sp. B21-053]UZE14244.1 toll/interleukin-1 receptor domain-containing protein [Pseudomonas sp. B21-053]